MAPRKYLARDYQFYISSDPVGVWTEISGINSWGFTTDTNQEDSSTFDNGAWGSNTNTQKTGGISLEGFFLTDLAGVRDQGQLLADRAGMVVGFEAYRNFMVVARPTVSGVRGPNLGGFTSLGQFSPGDRGGGVTDLDPWSTEFAFEGKPVGSGIFDIFNG